MDNNNRNPETNSSWLDDILGTGNVPKEMGATEVAAAVNFNKTDDEELERIVQETMAENWGTDSTPADQTQVFSAEEAPEQPPVEDPFDDEEEPEKKPNFFKRFRKLRERIWGSHKKPYGLFGLPHIVVTAVWLAIIVMVGTVIGQIGWACATDLLALGKQPQQVTITIEESDDIHSIAEKLEKAGMIEYPELFIKFAEFTEKDENILVGTITFRDDMVYDYNALMNAMSYKGGAIITVEVMIPEGYSCAQIFQLLEQKGVCSVSELEEYAANGELEDYWFIRDLERGHKYCLEGFLFPDTYEFYLDDDPKNVLEKFLDDFEYRFTQRMLDKYAALLKNTGLTLSIREVITMASIIEKEKANNLEGYTISSVFYNRLMDSANYPYLNSDATLLYDEEYYTGRPLIGHERAASPYNTYTQTGLPQGPISNPGLSSIDAALAPENTDYYFFVFDKEANHHRFSKTLREHELLTEELGY